MKIPYPLCPELGQPELGTLLTAPGACLRGEGSPSPLSNLHRLQGCQVSALYGQYFYYSSARPDCLSLMPTFLLPRIRQCFAATRQTLIMHYAVNTVIIYVNTKLFKEM